MITASSDDLTGNIIGADWMLEDGNINLIGTYFVPETPEMMKEFPIEFGPFDFITNIVSSFIDTLSNLISNPKKFKGKTPLDIASTVFEIVSFIPGPVGLGAGLVGFGLDTAAYTNKIRRGTATTTDHVDYSIGALGTLTSCIPGARTAKGLDESKSVNIIKRTNAIGSRVKLIGEELDCMSTTINVSKSGIESMSKLPSATKDLLTLYENYNTLENLMLTVAKNTKTESDIDLQILPYRQKIIDTLSSIAKNNSCVNRKDQFAHIIASQYGTCTVNETFVDNVTTEINQKITKIKINPRTIVYVWPKDKLLPSPTECYMNDDPLYVDIRDINNNGTAWNVRARALDNVGTALIYNGFDTPSWCVRNTVMNYFGIKKIVLKPRTGVIISTLFNAEIAKYDNYTNQDVEIILNLASVYFVTVCEYDTWKRIEPSE